MWRRLREHLRGPPDPDAFFEDELIYPVWTLDGTQNNRKLLSWPMLFNDVLDADQLYGALWRLLEMDDWRKLGGRLRYNGIGDLEIYAPPRFTIGDVPATYSCQRFDVDISEHHLANHFPRPSKADHYFTIPADLRPLIIGPGAPATIDALIARRLPQLSLHVCTFTDGTIVSLTWPHTLMDACGFQALTTNWAHVLNGKLGDVDHISGAHADITCDLRLAKTGIPSSCVLHSLRLGVFQTLRFICKYLGSNYMRLSQREVKMFQLPREKFERLRRSTTQSISTHTESSHPDGAAFVTEGDTLIAWIISILEKSSPLPFPVTVLNYINLRTQIPILARAGGVYLQNLVFHAWIFISAELAGEGIGAVALSHREQFSAQNCEQHILHHLDHLLREIESGKVWPSIFGTADATILGVNNLLKVDLIRTTNFCAALLQQGEQTRTRGNPLGTMVSQFSRVMDSPIDFADVFNIMGKCHDGSIWLVGGLSPETWKHVENEMAKL